MLLRFHDMQLYYLCSYDGFKQIINPYYSVLFIKQNKRTDQLLTHKKTLNANWTKIELTPFGMKFFSDASSNVCIFMKISVGKWTWSFDRSIHKFDNNGFCSEVSLSLPKTFDFSWNLFLNKNQEELNITKHSNCILLLLLSMPVLITIWNTC